MTNVRWVELYKNKSLSADAGNESFDIKTNEEILELLLIVRAKNGSTSNSPNAKPLETIESSIQKIEINSGSLTLKSYTGEICRKLATYRDGYLPSTLYTQAGGGTWAGNDDPTLGWQEYAFPIYFNLRCDPYGDRTGTFLPAPLFDILTLNLEYDFKISSTEGFTSGGANHVFDLYALTRKKENYERLKRRNILIEKKKQDYTTVASGDEPIPLTTSKRGYLRQLLIFSYQNGIGEGIDLTQVKYRVEGSTIVSSKWGQLQHLNAMERGLNYYQDFYLKAQTTDDELWTRIPAPIVHLTAGTAPSTAPYFGTLGNGDKVTVTTDAANDINLLRISSPVIPCCVFFDFDRDCSLRHLQPLNVNDHEVILTNGNAGGAVQIIEQFIARADII